MKISNLIDALNDNDILTVFINGRKLCCLYFSELKKLFNTDVEVANLGCEYIYEWGTGRYKLYLEI